MAKQLIPTGTERNDCVQTPFELSLKVVKHFKPVGKILEPCAGDGSFLRALPQGVYWCEILHGNDSSKKRKEVLKVIGREPLFGHPNGSKIPTHWFCFMKIPENTP